MTIDPKNLAGTATLTFNDDFNAFDTGKWGTAYPWDSGSGGTNTPNNEEQWYLKSDYAAQKGIDTYVAHDGVLDINAAPTPSNLMGDTQNHPYTSGMINTDGSFSQTYGYFEMKAALPAGQGMWPAFWLLPTDHSWPPEIDVMETIGSEPDTLNTTVHYGNNQSQGHATDLKGLTGDGQFHTYGVDWEPDNITWYLDGKQVYQTATPAGMDKPMYMLANLAVGGNWPGSPDGSTEFPASMSIDYIRAYSSDPNAKPVTTDPASGAEPVGSGASHGGGTGTAPGGTDGTPPTGSHDGGSGPAQGTGEANPTDGSHAGGSAPSQGAGHPSAGGAGGNHEGSHAGGTDPTHGTGGPGSGSGGGGHDGTHAGGTHAPGGDTGSAPGGAAGRPGHHAGHQGGADAGDGTGQAGHGHGQGGHGHAGHAHAGGHPGHGTGGEAGGAPVAGPPSGGHAGGTPVAGDPGAGASTPTLPGVDGAATPAQTGHADGSGQAAADPAAAAGGVGCHDGGGFHFAGSGGIDWGAFGQGGGQGDGHGAWHDLVQDALTHLQAGGQQAWAPGQGGHLQDAAVGLFHDVMSKAGGTVGGGEHMSDLFQGQGLGGLVDAFGHGHADHGLHA